jgi:CAAX protease family protein
MEDVMSITNAFIKSHPVRAYFALTFVISWGGFLLAVGPGGFASTNWQAGGRFPFVVVAMLGGPSVAGLLLTRLVDGTAGLRELLSRLLRWRVGVGWYAFAVLPAPLLAAAALRALSLDSPVVTADNKAVVVLSGAAAGLATVLEEIGWTGFAVPRLRRRYGVVTTGLIVGVLWGAWHLLQGLWTSGTYRAAIPLAVFLPVSVLGGIAQLTAYRVLLVWVYDRTGSLLVVTLMHASLTASTIFIFRPLAVGVPFLACGWLLAAALWVVVAAVAIGRKSPASR